jgi:hypothetical protein
VFPPQLPIAIEIIKRIIIRIKIRSSQAETIVKRTYLNKEINQAISLLLLRK